MRKQVAAFVTRIDSLLEHETPGAATERRHRTRRKTRRPRTNVAYETTRAKRESPPRQYAAKLRAKMPARLQPHLIDILAFLKRKHGKPVTDEVIAAKLGRTIGAVHTALWRLRKLGLVHMLPV